VLVSLSLVFGLALVGQAGAGWLGGRLRHAIHNEKGQRVDDVGGVIVSVLALLAVAWMVAVPLASSPMTGLARSVRNSAILHAVDAVVPNGARVLYDRLQDTIAAGDFPQVFGDLTPTRARQVDPPDPALLALPAVEGAHPSVVKVTGTAPSCRRRIEGSGFVYAPQHVMTNAHVVAGTEGGVNVETVGASATGRVVYYDPDRDLAGWSVAWDRDRIRDLPQLP
jgi:S1-C subfamily serine protease